MSVQRQAHTQPLRQLTWLLHRRSVQPSLQCGNVFLITLCCCVVLPTCKVSAAAAELWCACHHDIRGCDLKLLQLLLPHMPQQQQPGVWFTVQLLQLQKYLVVLWYLSMRAVLACRCSLADNGCCSVSPQHLAVAVWSSESQL